MTIQSKRDRSFRARTLVPTEMHAASQTTLAMPGPARYPAGTMVWVTRNLWLRRFGPWGSEYTAWVRVGDNRRTRIRLSEVAIEDDGAVHADMTMRERIIIGAYIVVLIAVPFLLFYLSQPRS